MVLLHLVLIDIVIFHIECVVVARLSVMVEPIYYHSVHTLKVKSKTEVAAKNEGQPSLSIFIMLSGPLILFFLS